MDIFGICVALEETIQVGAPLFNAGRQQACADLYRGTAERLLDAFSASGDAPVPPFLADSRQCLRDAVEHVRSIKDDAHAAKKSAWALRRAFDEVLLQASSQVDPSLSPSERSDHPAVTVEVDRTPEHGLRSTVVSFTTPESVLHWGSLDDAVMGGVSRSVLSFDKSRSHAVFRGTLSLMFNGGFASVRTRCGFPAGDWKGVEIDLCTDGRMYKFVAKTENQGSDGGLYQRDIPAQPAGVFRKVYLPFSSFVPTFRGRVVSSLGALRPSDVRLFGFMISKLDDQGRPIDTFGEGSFELQVSSISLVREKES